MPEDKHMAARAKLQSSSANLLALVGSEEPASVEALKAAIDEEEAAIKEVADTKGKAKPTPAQVAEDEEAAAALAKAIEAKEAIEKEAKKKKDDAKKRLQAAAQKAHPFTGDLQELQEALEEAKEIGVEEKALDDPMRKLTEMMSFHYALKEATSELQAVGKGKALDVDRENLEMKIAEHSEGAVASLKKVIVELYLQLLTKPGPTQIATDALDESVEEAKKLGIDEAIWKPMKRKSDDAKKAQNAKKIADRKAKKPPSDPPAPPDQPEAHPTVEVLKTALEEAMAAAVAKLAESNASHQLVIASNAKLLTADNLLDLEERPNRDDAHPILETLANAVKAAEEAKAEKSLLESGQKALDEGRARRLAARTSLALSKMATCSSPPPIEVKCEDLGKAIEIAKAEKVDEANVKDGEQKLYDSYKKQSEAVLEPLSKPEEVSHEGFQIIDPLKAALDEARKRGANEELLIKGQAKYDFWIEARNRRDNAKKALDKSLSPPPTVVEQPTVHACLAEASDAKLDPKLLKEAADKLRVAELAQRVYEKSKAAPGSLAIAVLEAELDEVGGYALAIEQEKSSKLTGVGDDLRTKIEAIKETQENQKMRDGYLAKQVKKGAHKERPSLVEDDLLPPAWVHAEDYATGSPGKSEAVSNADKAQAAELAKLQERLKAAEVALKAQEEAVKATEGTVIVPQDVINFAQLKLKAAKICDEMQKAQEPMLLDLDSKRLQTAIKASEFKFGELPISGLGDLDCNVPSSELQKARYRLKDAEKAQQRQRKARSQLQARVAAPTGTSTFDTLVKLVAEAKAAEVEEELIARAELKLKKMEDLAASSLRAGPLAFVSFHLPCLKSCVSRYAISLIEQAEEKRKLDFERQEAAKALLLTHIGSWEKGQIDKTLLLVDVSALREAIHEAALEGLSQDLIEMGRLKLVAIEKYKIDKERGLIKDDGPKKKEESSGGGPKAKPKFKNYGYVKKEEEGGG